jgi:hypothetical protein
MCVCVYIYTHTLPTHLSNTGTQCLYIGNFLSKNCLRISPTQVDTPRRFKVARPQSSVGFVPSKFSTDCII